MIKNIPGKFESYWEETTPKTNYPALDKDLKVDIVIIGCGISGLNTTYLLQEKGYKVVLIEMNRIATGTSGYTTAKITSLHELKYDYLISNFGQENAQIYADSNQWAIEKFDKIINKNKIACDFVRLPAFTYTLKDNEIDKIQKEVKAAKKLQLPAEYIDIISGFPIKTKAAIKFNNQATFHPRKYLLNLAEIIIKNGGQIYEQTKAANIKEGNITQVITDKGTIMAKKVVIATNYPFFDKEFFSLKMGQIGSDAIAVKLKGKAPGGMYLETGKNGFSFRPQIDENGQILIAGGGIYRVGEEKDISKIFQNIIDYTSRHFQVESVGYHWSAQDSSPVDHIPYIGQMKKNIYVATGFDEWGMTTSMVAARIITDLIDGKENHWTELYDPSRINLKAAAGDLLRQGITTAKQFVGKRILKTSQKPSELKKDEGKVIDFKKQKVAAYKDRQGKLYTHSAVCTHLGCIVNWNKREKTWDCPCHGSRFKYDGKVIHGPAQKDLPKVKI